MIWVRQHLEHEESLYWCGALVVEPRYLGPRSSPAWLMTVW
jgi:hypothetical protein